MNLRDFRLEIFASRLPSKVKCTASGPNEMSRERFFKYDFHFQTSVSFIAALTSSFNCQTASIACRS